MTPHTALRACIEALEKLLRHFTRTPSTLADSAARLEAHQALAAARAALEAQPVVIPQLTAEAAAALEAQAEPVAWMDACGACIPTAMRDRMIADGGASERTARMYARALYAAPAQPAEDVCWCDQQGIGEPGVSCGDCPTRDYKSPAAQPATVPALTDEQIDDAVWHLGFGQLSPRVVARAVERACASRWGVRLAEGEQR